MKSLILSTFAVATSSRTKEALDAKRKLGIIGGRPKGPAKNLKLDKQKYKIVEYLRMGLS
ncbi:hypothetical protein [Vibrio sp. 99-70-13A1]|uniref:hypothetical protein n=1 Tax=Vibrio sp. 99-70-13A1 TaxID=2607601 RepID=UPI001493CE49|nr:hypothetical protein [Vibrio sp. 99-70-13A1]NOH99476.1 hypothetical protein [Vibrio sp. 99-70-13A1]